jgi:hypothetical protein
LLAMAHQSEAVLSHPELEARASAGSRQEVHA